MAARGTVAKETLKNLILEKIAGATVVGKEIRVPLDDGGEVVEIKLTMTAAKDSVLGKSGDIAESTPVTATPTPSKLEPTEEEKKNLEALVSAMGF